MVFESSVAAVPVHVHGQKPPILEWVEGMRGGGGNESLWNLWRMEHPFEAVK